MTLDLTTRASGSQAAGEIPAGARPLSLVVLGGGTAGWIAACWLLRQFGRHPAVRITLVESKAIGILGVGEATLPTLIPFLRMLGISEAEFMAATKASFKRGILYKGWAEPPTPEGPNGAYFHPFASAEVATFNSGDWWIAKRKDQAGADYAADFSAQGPLALAHRTPRCAEGSDYEGDDPYAYHMDAELFAEFLADWCKARGVVHLIGEVEGADVDPAGYVGSLRLKGGGRLAGDVFLDCSGFRGLLINQAQGNGFLSFGDTLFCDQAVALRVPHVPGQAIRPFTTTTAWPAGWLWEIDLQGRSGLGYVHSSRHTTFDEAETALRAHIGPAADHLPVRRLKMRVGRSQKLWDTNVIAVGLSGGFIEPLESTGIYLVEAGARHAAKALAGLLPGLLELKLAERDGRPTDRVSREVLANMIQKLSTGYNAQMAALYAEICDFVKVHFSLTNRRDSDFWIDNAQEQTNSDALNAALDLWRYRCPDAVDFQNRFALFNEANWIYVMLGMGWRPAFATSTTFHADTIGGALMRRAREQHQQGLRRLPTHEVFLAAAPRFSSRSGLASDAAA